MMSLNFYRVQAWILCLTVLNDLVFLIPGLGFVGREAVNYIIVLGCLLLEGLIVLAWLLGEIKERLFYFTIWNIILFCMAVLMPIVFWNYYQDGRLHYLFAKMLLPLSLMFFSPKEVLSQAFIYFRRIFALILLPAVVLYPLIVSGIDFSIAKIIPLYELKAVLGYYYADYILTFRIHESTSLPYGFYRLSAWFEEPGVVGTLAAFLLAADHFRWNKENLVILLAAILSMSLAFYTMIYVYILTKKPKMVIAVTALMALLYIGLENALLQHILFDRIGLGGGEAFSRSNTVFDKLFERFIHSSDVWLGNTKSILDSKITVSSWKNLIWDYGVIGTAMLALFYLTALMKYRKYIALTSGIVVYCVLFMMNIYQRPYVFNVVYYFIFSCGIVHLITYSARVSDASMMVNNITDHERFSSFKPQQVG